MPEQNKPFVITDRRRFNTDGEPRLDADPSPEREQRTPTPEPVPTPEAAVPTHGDALAEDGELDLPPALTEEQVREAKFAYDQTAERLDTAIRAANPGMDRIPDMSFERLVQSVYMTAIMQLGGSTPEGEQPRIDLMGARQSVDMLGVLSDKTKGNLSESEERLLDGALFELRIAFLDVTQALARSAQAKAPNGPGTPGRPGPGGPSIVR